MNRKWIKRGILLLLFTLLLSLPVIAENPRLRDDAGLLSDGEYEKVLLSLDTISHAIGMDVTVVTTNERFGYSGEDYCRQSYGSGGYRPDGCILAISMAERDWYMLGFGEMNRCITDSAFYELSDGMLPYLSNGYYADAFIRYAKSVESFVNYYRTNGSAYEPSGYEEGGFEKDYKVPLLKRLPKILLVAVILGGLLAFIPVLIMKGKLKSVKTGTNADRYFVANSLQLTNSNDLFLYHTITKTPRNTDNGRSGGGGGHSSSHVGGGGFSHSGGGGKF